MTETRSRSRSAARLAAVQALYQQEMEGTSLPRLLREFHEHRLGATIEDDTYHEAEHDFFDDVVLVREVKIEGANGQTGARTNVFQHELLTLFTQQFDHGAFDQRARALALGCRVCLRIARRRLALRSAHQVLRPIDTAFR